MNRKSGMSIAEAAIVLAILLLVAAISVPALFQNQSRRHAAECAANLEAVSTACQRYASEVGGFPHSLSELVPAYLEKVPACPSGGTYTLGTPEGDPPTCSIPGHHL